MKSKKSNRYYKPIATLALTALAVSTLSIFPSVATADPITKDECFPAVLMLRGSGESKISTDFEDKIYYPEGASPSDAYIETNGHEGPTLSRVLERFSKSTDPSETVSKLRFIGIDYPSEAVEPSYEYLNIPSTSGLPTSQSQAVSLSLAAQTVAHAMKYSDSVNQGAVNVENFIKADEGRNCDTQYILMGYSQGALSARIAMNLRDNNTDKIIGSYFLGDPFQKANATLADQKSLANTGYDKDGVLRFGFNFIASFANLGIGASIPTGLGPILAGFNSNLAESDKTVYGSTVAPVSSRSLCHKYDPVCSLDLLNISKPQHENYFLESDPEPGQPLPPGNVDLSLETPGLDSQLKALADSQPGNPRERVLTTTTGVSVVGSPTVYNVANARPDDLCSWDEGSDGSFEAVSIPCATYEVMHTGTDAKISVKVVDSFGIEHLDSLESDVLDPEAIANLTGVPYDQWLRFESYVDPAQCLTIAQDFKEEFSGPGTMDDSFRSLPCIDSPSSNYDSNATQTFKRTSALDESSEKLISEHDGLPVDHYLWGYDDDYRVTANTFRGNGPEGVAPAVELSSNDPYDYQGFRAVLAQVKDGVLYYQLQMFWGGHIGCIAYGVPDGEHPLKECSVSDDSQLFSVVPVNDEYGDLSVEKDTTPPSAVENFTVDESNDFSVTVSWNHSTDERMDEIAYYIIERNGQYLNSWQEVQLVPGNTSTAVILTYNTDSELRISAYDYAYNQSGYTVLKL